MRLPVLLALCLLIPGHSLARDAEVVRPGPGALSAALDAAAPGATLRLAPGLHDGGVRLDRPVTLLCDPGAVIDAHRLAGYPFHLEARTKPEIVSAFKVRIYPTVVVIDPDERDDWAE